jgi:TonB family protein
MKRQRRSAVSILLFGLVAGAALAAEKPAGRPEVLKHANDLLEAGKFAEAEGELHRAEGLAGGPCGECALGIATVRASEGKWEESADMIQRALPLLTESSILARAYNQLGMAYAKGAGGTDHLTKAESAMRNAVDYGGSWGQMARRNLAQILLLEERWGDAVPVAREALEKAGAEPGDVQAARIILCQARAHLEDELPETASPVALENSIVRPQRIAGPPPQYTAEARTALTEGAVVVESTIDREGCVRHPKVLKELPNGLTTAALEAIRLWVFSPAVQNGKPVPALYTLTVNFKASKDAKKPSQP